MGGGWGFDSFLGDFETDISKILLQPGKWAIQEEYGLSNLKNKSTDGEVTGSVKLWIGFSTEGEDPKKFESMSK